MRTTIAVITLLVAACQATPPASPSEVAVAWPSVTPTGSVSPAVSTSTAATATATVASTPEPTDAPIASPTAARAVLLERDSFARVVTSDLRVRSKPGVSDDSAKFEPLLQDGTYAFVLEGPVAASGYYWYLVLPFRRDRDAIEPPFGWVAAADKDGSPWLAAQPISCPETPVAGWGGPDMEGVTNMYRHLACFRDKPQTFQSAIGRPGDLCGVFEWRLEPSWFDTTCPSHYLSGDDVALDVFLPPGVVPPTVDPDSTLGVDVTAQYDHPEARNCRLAPAVAVPTTAAPPPELVVLTCRAQFVATSIAITADP